MTSRLVTSFRVQALMRWLVAALIGFTVAWSVVFAVSAETRAIGRQGMVATSSPEASAVGAQMLKAGGLPSIEFFSSHQKYVKLH